MQKNNYDDKLFDTVLKIAAEEALKQEIEEIPSCEELNEQYKPSHNLDKRIKKNDFTPSTQGENFCVEESCHESCCQCRNSYCCFKYSINKR